MACKPQRFCDLVLGVGPQESANLNAGPLTRIFQGRSLSFTTKIFFPTTQQPETIQREQQRRLFQGCTRV